MVVVLVIGAVIPVISDRLSIVGLALLWLAPSTAARLFTQVLSAELHGRGYHQWVAKAFLVGLLGWVGLAYLLVTGGADVGKAATGQTLVELVVLASLAWRYRSFKRERSRRIVEEQSSAKVGPTRGSTSSESHSLLSLVNATSIKSRYDVARSLAVGHAFARTAALWPEGRPPYQPLGGVVPAPGLQIAGPRGRK